MWIVDRELSEIEKKYFITVAKALALAQRFENNLKTLAFEAEIILSQKSEDSMSSFDKIVERTKRNSKVFTMIRNFQQAYSDEDITRLFDNARNARNLIVHCSLEGCYSGSYAEGIPIQQADMLKSLNNSSYIKQREQDYISQVIDKQLNILRQQVNDLALGDFYAGIIEWNVNVEHGNYPFNAKEYAQKMLDWVFSDIDNPSK